MDMCLKFQSMCTFFKPNCRGRPSGVSRGGRRAFTTRSWPGSGVQTARLQAQRLRRGIPLPLSGCGRESGESRGSGPFAGALSSWPRSAGRPRDTHRPLSGPSGSRPAVSRPAGTFRRPRGSAPPHWVSRGGIG